MFIAFLRIVHRFLFVKATLFCATKIIILWHSYFRKFAFPLRTTTILRKMPKVQILKQSQKQVLNGYEKRHEQAGTKITRLVSKNFPKWRQKSIEINVKINVKRYKKLCSEMTGWPFLGWGKGSPHKIWRIFPAGRGNHAGSGRGVVAKSNPLILEFSPHWPLGQPILSISTACLVFQSFPGLIL